VADDAATAFNHVGHCVADLDRSLRFYTELLGFELERRLEVPDSPTDRLLRMEAPLGATAVYLRKDGFVLELLHFDRPSNPPARERPLNEPGLTHISLSVDDVAATTAGVPAFGGEVLWETDVGAAIFIRDPDGQLIELLPMAYRRQIEATGA
jgi:catechol 2,3-dioxygenase-like lactoylglutathione lyase family enzyme